MWFRRKKEEDAAQAESTHVMPESADPSTP